MILIPTDSCKKSVEMKEAAISDVSDKSPCRVGFSPRENNILREAWAKAHVTSSSVGHVISVFEKGR